MEFKLGLAQIGHPHDGDVVAQVTRVARQAADAGVELLTFPEDLMSPRTLSAPELKALAEPLDGPFLQAMADIAAACDLWLVGTMSETNPAGGQPFNTAFVLDDRGHLQRSYRKCHLYDAHQVRESDRMSAGDALCEPVATPWGTLGVAICYDLRFPEVARAAALAGSDLILYPAAWYDGPRKLDHWETLLRARAIENECFVAGVCRGGSHLVGDSIVVSPLGEVLARGPRGADSPAGEALVVAQIDLEEVVRARDAMPLLDHRRPELY